MSSTTNGKFQIRPSAKARRTDNPIRNLVDRLDLKPNPEKEFIPLSIGDPTTFGNLPPDPNVLKQVETVLKEGKTNGYVPSFGALEPRQAVADFVACSDFKPTPADVFLASGCSSALEMAITVLADPGENILIPRPGFSLYKVICHSHDIKFKYYDLLPQRSWEADLQHTESQIDSETRAILVNNPSNPCGSVFTREHIRAIIDVAERHHLPIIADEIYADFVFGGNEFIWFAEESGNVPIISCGGIAKRYVVPGWRLGWTVIFDRGGVLDEVRKGMVSLTQVILGPNSLIQGALPKILTDTPKEYYTHLIDTVEKNAILAYKYLSGVPGVTPIMPAGAMYMMCCVNLDRLPCMANDLDFVQHLVKEESVFVLPGKCFDYANTFRIVLTVPVNKMETACKRIADFCRRHYQEDTPAAKKVRLENIEKNPS